MSSSVMHFHVVLGFVLESKCPMLAPGPNKDRPPAVREDKGETSHHGATSLQLKTVGQGERPWSEVSSPQEDVELGCCTVDQTGEKRKTFREKTKTKTSTANGLAPQVVWFNKGASIFLINDHLPTDKKKILLSHPFHLYWTILIFLLCFANLVTSYKQRLQAVKCTWRHEHQGQIRGA